MEERRTAELLSDFDDYEIFDSNVGDSSDEDIDETKTTSDEHEHKSQRKKRSR
jgi:hypothetical protein